jgi:hypothetical protein
MEEGGGTLLVSSRVINIPFSMIQFHTPKISKEAAPDSTIGVEKNSMAQFKIAVIQETEVMARSAV